MAFVSKEHTREYIISLVERSRAAQRTFEHNYKDQRSIDEVVRAVGYCTVEKGKELCEAAIAETGMGNLESKIQKLIMTAGSQWKICRGKQSVGYTDCAGEPGARYFFKPLGVIGAVMPSTNPLATIIGNAMMCLKCRNSIIIAPHPNSAHISEKTCEIVRQALRDIGAPEDLLLTISAEEACVEATDELLHQCDVNIGTGGAGMVKAVYSAGKPAFGVGQGNCQEIIDRDIAPEEYTAIAQQTIFNRAWDNGVPCSSDQTLHIPEEMEEHFVKTMKENGAYVLESKEEIDKLREVVFPNGQPRINRAVVGRLPWQIGKMAGLDVPESAKIILLKNQAWGSQDLLCREIMCPIMRYTTYSKFEDAVDRAVKTLYVEGAGHSSSIWSHTQEHIDYAADLFPVGRFHVNQPTSGRGNGLWGTITIGCGSWGGNSISENLAWFHLYNKTKVSTVVPNLRPFNAIEEFENYEPWKITLDE